MPYPRKPNALKIASGSREPLRDEAPFERVSDVPPRLDWLDVTGKQEWDRLAPELHALGLLTRVSLGPLGHLCALHADLVHLRRAHARPDAALSQAYRSLCGDFGLVPAAQSRVSVRSPVSGDNPFSKFAKAERRPKQ